MAFDIEKMKADGVSTHLIELASMDSTVFLTMIARRLENDGLFKQFMGESASSIEGMYPYAVAAGLMSESDREWLLDEGNPYKPQGGEVWYTVTVPSGECNESGYSLPMTSTPNARTSELVANPNAYDVSVNGVVMSVAMAGGGMVAFSDADLDNYTVLLEMEESRQALDLKCPPRFDAGTNVEVTVSHK